MKELLTIFAIVMIVFITGCKKDDFEEIETECPVVVTTDPVNLAVDVLLDKTITATFNSPMDSTTINNASFIIEAGPLAISATAKSASLIAAQITGTISYSNSVASFRPHNPLLPFVVYTGRIKTSARNIYRSSLQEDYVWTFTTIPEVTLAMMPVTGGDATGAGVFPEGSLVTVTAKAFEGYTFVNWTSTDGAIVSSDSSWQFIMAGNRDLLAHFTSLYLITLTANPVEGGSTLGWGEYTIGDQVTAAATANEGYTFVNWTEEGTVVSTNANYQFEANSNRTLLANFSRNAYTLNVTAVNGTVAKNPNQASYNSGSTVLLTATPSAGYAFTSWSGNATGNSNPLTVTMNGNKNITANFTAIPPTTFTLNVLSTNGTVVKNPNLTSYNSGALVVLTATPAAGYTFTSWSGDATGSVNPLTVIMNADKNITANYTAIPSDTYTLNVTANNGSVGINPDLINYTSGSSVVLTATPAAGYTFTSWSGDATGSVNPLNVTMNGNKNITANFTAIPYTLNVTANNGTVAKNPNQVSYTIGTIVGLTATPAAGYTFTSWSGDATGNANPLNVTMNGNKNITANFTAIPPSTYTINITANNGTVVKNPNLTNYASGAIVELTATPAVGYTFTSWSGDATGSANPLNVTMNANKNIMANFTAIPPNTYSLNVIANNGTVVKNPNLTSYASGAIVELTATPAAGYTFTSWSGDATGSVNPVSITMNANKNVTANFTAIPTYTINITANNGTVVKNPNLTSYASGAIVELTATPAVGYTFTSWSGDATGSVNPVNVTMNANKNITANFTAIPPSTYTLNITANNGTVLKNPNLTEYASGAIVELTATPNSGYVFTSWSGDASGSVSPVNITMNANKNVTANFSLAPPLGPGAIDLGTAADFTIAAKSGISTTGVTSITGDIGVSPAAATFITGFGLIMHSSNEYSETPIVVGRVYAADYAPPTPAKMTAAISDMETALTTANGLTTNVIVDLYAGDISGRILPPGLYKWGTGVLISNAGVTLTGGPNDTWVFQIAQDLTVNNSAIITLAGGAQAKNIFWVVSGQANLGTNVNFSGNILSQTLISVNTGSSVLGRLLAQTAVTLNASTVVQP